MELCESLDMPPAQGVTSLELFFDDDLDGIQKLHGKVVGGAARMSGPCPVCGCLPTGDAAGERMQVAKGGCLCNELRVEFGTVAPARIKFGKHKDRTLMEVYFEEPDYMRWLVENASQNQLKPSETDRFIARVGQCEHYLTEYFFEREPEPVALPASDPMDRLTRQRYGTLGMDRISQLDDMAETGLILSDGNQKAAKAGKASVTFSI